MKLPVRQRLEWLMTYCTLAWYVGLFLVAFGVISLCTSSGFLLLKGRTVMMQIQGSSLSGAVWFELSHEVGNVLIPGAMILILVALIQYLIGHREQPGMLLKFGVSLLYLASVFYGFVALINSYSLLRELRIASSQTHLITSSQTHLDSLGIYFSSQLILMNLGPAVAKVLIIAGLAHALRRLLPVIAESKTLA